MQPTGPTGPSFPHAQANRFAGRSKGAKGSPGDGGAEAPADYGSKLLHLSWHPEADVIACAAQNSLYM